MRTAINKWLHWYGDVICDWILFLSDEETHFLSPLSVPAVPLPLSSRKGGIDTRHGPKPGSHEAEALTTINLEKIGCKVEALVNHEAEAKALENHEAEARLPKI